MTKPDINQSIETIINTSLNQQPTPQKVYLTKIYDDNIHCDAKTLNNETLTYIPMICNNPAENHIGILFHLDNEQMMIITK